MATNSLPIPGAPQELTAAWLTAALRAGGVLRAAAVADFACEPLGGGEGLIGQLARVRLRCDPPEEGAPATLIAKFPSAHAANRAIGMRMGFYEVEGRFYQEIAEDVDLRTARCYFTGVRPETEEFLLLLEDLAPARCGDQ